MSYQGGIDALVLVGLVKCTVGFVGNAGLGNWDLGFIDREYAKPDSG